MPARLAKPAFDLGIVTNDPDAALGFYRDLLGFPEIATMGFGDSGTNCLLAAGDMMVKIVHAGPLAVGPKGDIDDATGFRYVTFWVSNLAEVLAECETAGVELLRAPFEVVPGITAALVHDPDGNVVEFLEQQPAG